MTDVTLQWCEGCGGEGRIYCGHPNDPHPRDGGECPACDGTGMAHDTRRLVKHIASAILNARGMKRGVPPVLNILEFATPRIREEVIADARAALEAIYTLPRVVPPVREDLLRVAIVKETP